MARVLLFGPLRDLAGWREREVAAHDLTDLRRLISMDDATLGAALAAAGVQTAVDQALVRGEIALTSASEVAFLPPMSGG